jgi:RNA polymerase sigma-70 factor, ECF subfamily
MNPFHTVHRISQLAGTLGERRKKLHRVAIAWCRNRTIADDLVQDTLVKALKNLGQLRETQAIDAWLFQIMSNCWRDNFRRERDLEEIGTYAEERIIGETRLWRACAPPSCAYRWDNAK